MIGQTVALASLLAAGDVSLGDDFLSAEGALSGTKIGIATVLDEIDKNPSLLQRKLTDDERIALENALRTEAGNVWFGSILTVEKIAVVVANFVAPKDLTMADLDAKPELKSRVLKLAESFNKDPQGMIDLLNEQVKAENTRLALAIARMAPKGKEKEAEQAVAGMERQGTSFFKA